MKYIHGGQAGILAAAAAVVGGTKVGEIQPLIDPQVGNVILLVLNLLSALLPQLIRREPMK